MALFLVKKEGLIQAPQTEEVGHVRTIRIDVAGEPPGGTIRS